MVKEDAAFENHSPEDKEVSGKTNLDDDSPSNDDSVIPSFQYLVPKNDTTLWDFCVVFFYHMLPFTVIPLIVDTLFLWWCIRVKAWFLFTLFWTICAISLAFPPIYNSKIRKILGFLYVPLAKYMKSVRIVIACKNKTIPAGRYIFGFHPHGRMFYSYTMMLQMDYVWRKPFLPQGELFGAAAGGFFSVPILRNLLYVLGVIPASKQNIKKCLREGNHVAIAIGGVKEVCIGTFNEKDVLYMKNRKGFIKIAIEENAGVIPIYCFDENQLFRHEPKSLLRFWETVNKRVNVGVPFMRGLFNLPLPYQRDLLCVVGEPLFAKIGESVDELHARYLQHLQKLFENYVRFSSNPKHKLVII